MNELKLACETQAHVDNDHDNAALSNSKLEDKTAVLHIKKKSVQDALQHKQKLEIEQKEFIQQEIRRRKSKSNASNQHKGPLTKTKAKP